MRAGGTIILAALWAAAGAARAEVLGADATGFQVRNTVEIAAPPAKVYDALGSIDEWWDSQHTWSGKASNLRLKLKAGACFCEKLEDGGGVQHMTVVYAAPGKALRLSGALGPLQTEGAAGTLSLVLSAKDGGTELVQTYTVGGYTKGGWTSWAPEVDGVLRQQMMRLKSYVETGKPR
ncbi:MAG: SRPBCC family protein [Nevskia sp.]|nr:SRPBCC family protein [Nevskia sp.]